ncbi:hypothetical protein T265_02783 [Opisthorchis viverrini]|uniref:Uncharacterized protein n=1 Tax=Opisthorchis viverrini TaxID=6198 RepID=A0A074ZTP9_OPIVI|nr:hypothetical protein T265_02783 [Opisthorchis viverrini]KER30848.1 hypothetical protein T265_02783 [Opisthorchis viverrini]
MVSGGELLKGSYEELVTFKRTGGSTSSFFCVCVDTQSAHDQRGQPDVRGIFWFAAASVLNSWLASKHLNVTTLNNIRFRHPGVPNSIDDSTRLLREYHAPLNANTACNFMNSSSDETVITVSDPLASFYSTASAWRDGHLRVPVVHWLHARDSAMAGQVIGMRAISSDNLDYHVDDPGHRHSIVKPGFCIGHPCTVVDPSELIDEEFWSEEDDETPQCPPKVLANFEQNAFLPVYDELITVL